MSDIYKIDLKIRDQQTLHKVLTTAKVDLNLRVDSQKPFAQRLLQLQAQRGFRNWF